MDRARLSETVKSLLLAAATSCRLVVVTAAPAILVLAPGCSVLFDAPSLEGVQIAKPTIEMDKAVIDQDAIQQKVLDQASGEQRASDHDFMEKTPIEQHGIQQRKLQSTDASKRSNDSLDLTEISTVDSAEGSNGRFAGTQKGCAGGKTTDDALLELRQRQGNGWAEVTLLEGIANFNNDRLRLAKSQFDVALGHGLAKPADRALAHMYRAFVDCIQGNTKSCAREFHDVYVESPGITVTTMASHPDKWVHVLEKEAPKCHVADGQGNLGGIGKYGQSRATLLVSRTRDGGSEVALSVKPGGVIMFDGHAVGETPPIKVLKVKPGAHSVVVKSDTKNVLSADILVGDGERVEIRYGVR